MKGHSFVTKSARLVYSLALKLKPMLIRVIPGKLKTRLRDKVLNAAYPQSVAVFANANESISDFDKGINLVGYNRAEMGIGESCRIAARSIDAVDIPFGVINFEVNNLSRMGDLSWVHKEIEAPRYNINIFHINADQMIFVNTHLGDKIFQGRYNIGYWHWELPDFPEDWKTSFNLVNEIWVPSRFVADSIAIKSPVPVVRIPHSIQVHVNKDMNRKHFNLPEKCFLFMGMYDVHSYQERKNPKAVIEAFKRAFSADDQEVGLVIKVNNSDTNLKEMETLRDEIASHKNIHLIQGTLTREEVNSLINNVNVFVSLHRSEGFGLGLAEAMYLGKAVIGTNWSANTDFMNAKNSCPVDYKLIEIGQDYGPYKAGQYWADPDIKNAANYMERLFSDPEYYSEIAEEGQKTIRNEYSPERVGGLIRERLRHLSLLS
ncbi:glycosyltransferase family 4 protein [Paenibacillus sp. RC84]|uniref:glycosyltransferase family 4 protein n=1 Tax=Paenibacillus sp. RC84 TaxID=3156252 RepID=UPI003511B844